MSSSLPASSKQPTILLTGANGGLGYGLAELFLEAGYRELALHYRNDREQLVTLLEKYDLSPDKHLHQAELSDETSVARMRGAIEAQFKPVTSLINLAGASTNGMSWKLSLADFKGALDANLISTFLCCREFIPGMRAAGTGRIVNTSSVVAFMGAAGASHYTAAKAGIVGFTKSIALELAGKGITANALALGYFDRGLINSVPADIQGKIRDKIPAGRFGQVREIFGSLELLLGPGGAYTTGQVMHINGGLYL